jgi:hypothetical protein
VAVGVFVANPPTSRCQGVAKGMEFYQTQLRAGGHDSLVASLQVVVDRLQDDWRLFLRVLSCVVSVVGVIFGARVMIISFVEAWGEITKLRTIVAELGRRLADLERSQETDAPRQ